MKHVFLSAALVLGFLTTAISPAVAQIYVQVAPPAPIVERVPARPGAGWVWVGGYYRWNGARYAWVPGHYSRHAGRWCTGGWHHNARRGWWFTNGHWC